MIGKGLWTTDMRANQRNSRCIKVGDIVEYHLTDAIPYVGMVSKKTTEKGGICMFELSTKFGQLVFPAKYLTKVKI